MIRESRLYVMVGLLATLWFLLLLLHGANPGFSFFGPLSTVVGAAGVLLVVFDRWLWRVSWLHPWFISVPVLRGTWRGEIVSSWVNPKTNTVLPPIETYVVIRQSHSRVRMTLITSESQSDLLTGSVIEVGDGVFQVAGLYLNTPKAQVRDRSQIHYGGFVLQIHGEPPQALEGSYWTDRFTRGDMKFVRHVVRLCCGIDDARAAFKESV